MQWNVLVRRLQALDEYGDGKGWVFHGTDHVRAIHIVNSGFNFNLNDKDTAPVFWGTANMAAGFAETKAAADSPPCILAARTRDVLSSGIAEADSTAYETGCSFRGDPYHDRGRADRAKSDQNAPWMRSLLDTGCFMVRGGSHVPRLRKYGIESLPLHPECIEARRARIDDRGRFTIPVHPMDDMIVIAATNDDLFPNRWFDNDAYMREFHPEASREPKLQQSAVLT